MTIILESIIIASLLSILVYKIVKVCRNKKPRKKKRVKKTKEIIECSICLENIENDSIVLSCNHSFHKTCIENWFLRDRTCPMCRVNII
jgi:hypothetical protein